MSAGPSPTLDQLAADPHPILARLRERAPVAWVPALSGWLVTGREVAIAVMRDDETFTVDDPRFSTARVIGPSMLSLDGPAHDRHRSLFAHPFRHAEVQRRLAATTGELARSLVAALAPGGEAELRSGLAAPLAVDVVAGALGLGHLDRAEVLAWYDGIVAAVDGVTAGEPVSDEGRAAFAALEAAVTAAMAQQGTLVAEVAGAGTLAPSEVVSNAAVLLFGGIVTAEGTTASALYHLLSHPDQLALVAADRSLLANAVEESLRLEPAAAVVDRYATHDVSLSGEAIRRGDLVRVSLAGANRDPATFPDPDRYDVLRENAAQHVAFARGPHACLGIHLARLETRCAVTAVLDLVPGITLDAERTTPPRGLVFRKPPDVWATWPAA